MRGSLAYVKLLIRLIKTCKSYDESKMLQSSPSSNTLSVNEEMRKRWINATTLLDKQREYSALHIACYVGNFEMVKFLIESGANVQ